MTAFEYIVLACVAAGFAAAVYLSFRRKKKGKGCCGNCLECSQCNKNRKDK